METKGWKVYLGTQTDKQERLAGYTWKSISNLFTIKSSADQFATLARKQFPADEIEVRSVLTHEGK